MPFLIANWKLIAVALVVGGLAFYAGLMRVERDAVKAEYAEFRTKVAQAAEAAAEAALKKTIADEQKKEKADAENAAALATLAGTIKRLRDADADRNLVPAAPAGTKCPDGQACFERAELERALRGYQEGVRGLVDEGSEIAVDLDTAKAWAKER